MAASFEGKSGVGREKGRILEGRVQDLYDGFLEGNGFVSFFFNAGPRL